MLYADDIVLLSPSVSGLQRMLDCCSDVSIELMLTFNCAKSCCIKFGQASKYDIANMNLCFDLISWVDSVKYLGLSFRSGKVLSIDVDCIRRKFYTACNCIYANSRKQSDLLQLQLQESYCLPILTYCTVSVHYNQTLLAQLNACWNSVYRRVFGFHRWESVRVFINGLGRLDFHHIRLLLLAKFYRSLLLTVDNLLLTLYVKFMSIDLNCINLSALLNNNFKCSSGAMKTLIYDVFATSCI